MELGQNQWKSSGFESSAGLSTNPAIFLSEPTVKRPAFKELRIIQGTAFFGLHRQNAVAKALLSARGSLEFQHVSCVRKRCGVTVAGGVQEVQKFVKRFFGIGCGIIKV